MKKKQKNKIQEMGCAHKGCKNTHKNSSGYCVEHAPEMDRQVLEVPPERTFPIKDRDYYGNGNSDY